MTEMLSTRDMTVRSVIGSRGQTFALERPVPVRAGQRVYYGIRFDGRPLVSVASDTPIFDRAEIDTSIQTPMSLASPQPKKSPARCRTGTSASWGTTTPT